MAELITYNGVEITDETSSVAVTHEMYAGGRPDTLSITFDDEDGRWPRWKPQIGDVITYSNDGVDTGDMYIYDMEISENKTRLYASSLPPVLKTRYVKAWEKVKMSQILSEFSDNYEIFTEDAWYKYKLCNTKISGFLNTMAELESSIFICHNNKLMIIGEEALENQNPVADLDCAGCRVVVRDMTSNLFDACIVQSGEYMGACRISSGERLYKPDIAIPCTSDAEASRYAKGLLRMANKQMYDIRWQGQMIPGISAGVCVNLINDEMPDHQGKMYVYRVRHEYHRNLTTIFMRRPLEGY